MKVKVIARSEEDSTKERSQDLQQFDNFWEGQKVCWNLDPSLHPQGRAHEYVRAVNAAKLDKVRIFPYYRGHSREVYHIKRMRSGDATHVLSGSDGTNVRVWTAKASEQLGVLVPWEKQRHTYLAAVKQRYQHLPEIYRIDRHRHLPKPMYKANKLRHAVRESERKKESRKRAHSATGAISHVPARMKRIVAEVE